MMDQFTYLKPQFTKTRDMLIVMHVLRNTITFRNVVHELFFPGLQLDSSRKVLKRLTKDDWLTQYSLWDNRVYYRLGQKSILKWGYPRKRGDKLGAQRLPYELGCLAYTCMDSKAIRKRLLPHELKAQGRVPWFPDTLMQWAYLWENNSLGTIRVEPRCGHPERVIDKLSKQLYRYCENKEFESLVESGRFFMVVVLVGPIMK